MYDRVVHMHESCEYDIVGERTGETCKTARVLKVSYKRVKENKYARFIKKKKKKKKTLRLLVAATLQLLIAATLQFFVCRECVGLVVDCF